MAFLGSLDITGSALTAERFRTDLIAQNIANAKTTVTASGTPYRRKQVVFEERPMTFQNVLDNASQQLASGGGVQAASVVESQRPFQKVYDPDNPNADKQGYVEYPNVDSSEEMMDMMAASNAYQLNLTVLGVQKSMISKALQMSGS